jgi:hypothetical protein
MDTCRCGGVAGNKGFVNSRHLKLLKHPYGKLIGHRLVRYKEKV